MKGVKLIGRLAVLLPLFFLGGCDMFEKLLGINPNPSGNLSFLMSHQTPASTTLSQDTTSLTTDPWWGGGNSTASPMAPSN